MTTEVQATAERHLHDQLRKPKKNFADGRQALEELRAKAAAQQQARPSDASRTRALQRLAAERAGLATIAPTSGPYGVRLGADASMASGGSRSNRSFGGRKRGVLGGRGPMRCAAAAGRAASRVLRAVGSGCLRAMPAQRLVFGRVSGRAVLAVPDLGPPGGVPVSTTLGPATRFPNGGSNADVTKGDRKLTNIEARSPNPRASGHRWAPQRVVGIATARESCTAGGNR